VPVAVTVNGRQQEDSVEPGLLLADYLRDTLGLIGTKMGCETGQCGACTVLLDGVSVKSCSVLTAQVDGSELTTVEGLAQTGALSPLQDSFSEKHAVQCGYCTPAMLISMTDLLSRDAQPEEAEIRAWMDGVICRCGVYQNVIRAVQHVATRAG